MNKQLQEASKSEISIDFRSIAENIQRIIEENADGQTIVAGTPDKPIVRDSDIIPVDHHFMDGVYLRGMRMSEGQLVVGHIHKHLHMCFLLSGRITVFNEHGENEYVAPCMIESTPGVKRILYAHEESVWYNTHKNPTNTTDLDVLEREIVAISYEEYEEYIKNK